MPELVFVHGRSQQGKDPSALKKEWIAAWQVGLDGLGLSLPIAEDRIRFPFYGDTLAAMVDGASADEAADVIIRDATRGDRGSEEKLAFVLYVLQDLQRQAGIPDEEVRAEAGEDLVKRGPLNWGWVQAILRTIDRHLPGASAFIVRQVTEDVYQYVHDRSIRSKIDQGVRAAVSTSVPAVVVSHSLGTVVAYNVLQDPALQCAQVPFFVTLGSPLGVNTIRRSLMPIRHPKIASRWYNAWDERDVVALFALDETHFDVDPSIENYNGVDNDTESHHGISGYLKDPKVAKRIYDALGAGE